MPIKPSEVEAKKKENIPKDVFEIFDRLIAKRWDGHQAVVSQDEVVEELVNTLKVERPKVFSEHWLDVEGAYRKAGWIVEFDKPGYNEFYPATFTFKKAKK